jgi:hypothetical protein
MEFDLQQIIIRNDFENCHSDDHQNLIIHKTSSNETLEYKTNMKLILHEIPLS